MTGRSETGVGDGPSTSLTPAARDPDLRLPFGPQMQSFPLLHHCPQEKDPGPIVQEGPS
jgi:hypothetical protein